MTDKDSNVARPSDATITEGVRMITPLPVDERENDHPDVDAIPDNMSLIAWLAGMDLLTPG